eukprot:TRINITY_DN11530_c0_g1_i1.p1 TRINITY_DN11530_c0_g1~~TRINITY_DN11530_c0_g1_i1.p1  ORF type:complete len:454 (+),score=62.72 TRINITY_DN11530_c0_g1_i1:25-1386(+)
MDESTIESILQQGEAAYERGLHKECMELCKQILDDDPSGCALYRVGTQYYYGDGVVPDEDKGMELILRSIPLLERSSQAGDPLAMTNLAYLLSEGLGLPKDEHRTLELYKAAADQGKPKAIFNLALLHVSSDDLQKDIKEAERLLLIAAEHNYEGAMSLLGSWYLVPKYPEIPENIPEALRLLTRASDMGCNEAKTQLAWAYQTGRGGEINNELAFRLYTEAAERGEEAAQDMLGRAYEYGDLTEGVNLQKAFMWYKKSADKGYSGAQASVGLFYLMGRGMDRVNLREAFRYLQLAANQSEEIAWYALGMMYQRGIYPEKDINEALRYYSMAAERNLPEAISRLGYLYELGEGVPRDLKKARALYELALESGDLEAQFRLGVMYLEGVPEAGLRKDEELGLQYISWAAEEQYPEAICKMAEFYDAGQYGCAVNRSYVLQLYAIAASKNYVCDV